MQIGTLLDVGLQDINQIAWIGRCYAIISFGIVIIEWPNC